MRFFFVLDMLVRVVVPCPYNNVTAVVWETVGGGIFVGRGGDSGRASRRVRRRLLLYVVLQFPLVFRNPPYRGMVGAVAHRCPSSPSKIF